MGGSLWNEHSKRKSLGGQAGVIEVLTTRNVSVHQFPTLWVGCFHPAADSLVPIPPPTIHFLVVSSGTARLVPRLVV